LVQKLNETIQPEKSGDYLSIGLLDIYGFEVFEINTFE
jgi:myosin heavy subunit